MPEQTDGQNPEGNADSQPLSPAPVEATIEQRVMALEAARDCRKDGKEPNDLASAIRTGERWLIGINGIALLVSLGIGIIYIFQLCEMQKSTTAATSAACTAESSLKLTRQMFEASQAAVFVSAFEIKTTPKHRPVWITVGLRNSGKTRATNVVGSIKLVRKTVAGKITQSDVRNFTRSTIAVDDQVTETLGVDGTWDDLRKYLNEDFQVTVEITYNDGVQRTTQNFCEGPVMQNGTDTGTSFAFTFEDCENIQARKKNGY